MNLKFNSTTKQWNGLRIWAALRMVWAIWWLTERTDAVGDRLDYIGDRIVDKMFEWSSHP